MFTKPRPIQIVIFILGGLLVLALSLSPHSKTITEPQKPQISPEVRRNFDAKIANLCVDKTGMIQQCSVDSSDINTTYTVNIKVYFGYIPYDFKQLLEGLCEQIHRIYKSGVYLVAYKGDRRMAECTWSIFDDTIKTKLFN